MTVSVHRLHNKVRLVQLHIRDGTVMGYDAPISVSTKHLYDETKLLHYPSSGQSSTPKYSYVRQSAGNTIILNDTGISYFYAFRCLNKWGRITEYKETLTLHIFQRYRRAQLILGQ